MDMYYGACIATVLLPMVCNPRGGSPVPMSFKDVYAISCHKPVSGENWAGGKTELASEVMKRIADASALYQDYLRVWHEECDNKK